MNWIKLNNGMFLNLGYIIAITIVHVPKYSEIEGELNIVRYFDVTDTEIEEHFKSKKEAKQRFKYLQNLLINPKVLQFNLNEQEGGK